MTDRGDMQTTPPGLDWHSASTLADVGQLTARWLEGDLPAVPGYFGPPDEETLPLVPVLAALNRGGFVTSSSQPGRAGRDRDGILWEQRAAIEGFTGPVLTHRIAEAARRAGLTVITHNPAWLPRWRIRYGQVLPVTRRDGEDVTSFGAARPRRYLRDSWTGYGACHRAAVDAVCSAWQVTVIDPQWGRQDLLWSVLTGAVTGGEA